MVGSVRNLAVGAKVAVLGAWLVVGALGSLCLGADMRDLAAAGLAFASLTATVAVLGATGPGHGRATPAALWGVRAAWVPFVLALVPELGWVPPSLAPLMMAPFVLGMSWLVSSHLRPASAPWRRLRLDAALLGAALLPVWLGPLEAVLGPLPFWGVPNAVLSALLVACGLCAGALLLRVWTTARALEPGARHPLWDRLAACEGWTTSVQGDTWQGVIALGSRRLTVTVEHDPVPVQTRLVMELPGLRGLTLHRGSSSLGDPVLDGHLAVSGDQQLALAVLGPARGAWLQVIHGWGGALRDGVLQIALEGDDPRRWVHLPEGASEDDALKQVLSTLQELAQVGEGRAEGARRAVVAEGVRSPS
jgi:hypothetical protein